MNRKRRTCLRENCSNDPYLGGLCQRHHEEDLSHRQLRNDALQALHKGIIDGKIPISQDIHKELKRLHLYWDRVCNVVQAQRGTDTMPLEEADYATEWCIALAQEIVKAQRELAAGKGMPTSLTYTGEWVWERFRNLDAGLCSNGIPRK